VYVLENIHKIDNSINKLSREEIKEIIESLLDTPKVKVEKESSVRVTLNLYCNLNIKFGDCLIYATIKNSNVNTIATFDRDFDKLDIDVIR
jgi:predicted nucleic-acid-binding protein